VKKQITESMDSCWSLSCAKPQDRNDKSVLYCSCRAVHPP